MPSVGSNSKPRNHTEIDCLGLRINPLSINEAVDQTLLLADSPSGGHYITKLYAEHIYIAHKNQAFKDVLNSSSISLPDGISFKWMSHYLYSDGNFGIRGLFQSLANTVRDSISGTAAISSRIGGIDFTIPLLSKASTLRKKVYILGSPKHSSLKDSALFISNKFPGINVVGHYDTSNAAAILNSTRKLNYIVKAIDMAKPDLILVCTGIPTQEYICQKLSQKINRGVVIAEGGSLDYVELGGNLKRSPELLRRTGLEWAWRLILEPSRIIRVLRCSQVIYYAYKIKNTKENRSEYKNDRPFSLVVRSR